MKHIFFDLDGTLIDASERLYRLFCHLVEGADLTFEEYWALKRAKISHKEILMGRYGFSEAQWTHFRASWMSQIEDLAWLGYDKPFVGVEDLLSRLKHRGYRLYIVTARQSYASAAWQIGQFQWGDLIDGLLVTEQKQEKHALILQNIGKIHEDDWMVGDTDQDIETGQKLGVKTAAVLSGFLNKESLLPYSPDVIVDSVLHVQF